MVEAKYCAMANATSETMWLRNLLLSLGVPVLIICYIMAIRLPYMLLIIHCFMSAPNILKWIAILFASIPPYIPTLK